MRYSAMDLENRKIGVWGYGKEGASILRFLLANYSSSNRITVLSDEQYNFELPPGAQQIHGQEALDTISAGHFDIIFKSPGISLYRPEIASAKNNGTVFSSATNLWFSKKSKTKVIIVTGTKGKSTSASLLYFIMKESGLSVSFAGNIGVCALDLNAETDFTILELSSYQLADLAYTPDYFIALNLYPEHLQWHQSHENYYKDKLAPLFHKGGKCLVIANIQNKTLKNAICDITHPITWFNDPEQLHVENNNLFDGKEKLEFTSPFKGHHNLENVAAIMTCCKLLNLNINDSLRIAEKFTPLPHRLQEFISSKGIICVNDSISTTPETASAALHVYKNAPLFLIMGGTDRGQDYKSFIQDLASYDIRGIALLPKNGDRLYQEINQSNISVPVFDCETLEQATTYAKANTKKGDVVLLSPGAPSYDQFKNFEERGNLFIKMMSE